MNSRILVVDDEECIRLTIKSFLSAEGYETATAESYHEAVTMVTGSNFDLIFADIVLESKTGIDFLREIREKNIKSQVVMITGVPTIETASEAVRLGAFDYIPKPVTKDTLLHIAKKAIQHKALMDEKERYRLNLEAIFNSAKEAIISLDNELSVIESNEAAKDICNITREGIGKPMDALLKHCGGKCLNAAAETLQKKQSTEIYRVECNHKQRPDQVVSVAAYPLQYVKDSTSGVVLTINDETSLAGIEQKRKERHQFHTMVGKSEKMQEIYTLIEDLADEQMTILITGESGTGKGLVAGALHYKGRRSNKPFIKVNCSALPENLLESELFGHVKGAFTGAVKDRIGRFQMADGGTIFLDEIGDVSPGMQLKLLKVLQEKEFEMVGDSNPVKVDVRIIAATNQNLLEKIKKKEFREDLYYRLKGVEISVPPLRDRKEDIPLLVKHFLNLYNEKSNKKIVDISIDAQKIFKEYSWPGNIRELEHTVGHAFILCQQNILTVDCLPPVLKELRVETVFSEDIKKDERQAILQVLEKTKWNRGHAARLLGMSRSTLYRKIEEYKIEL